LLLIAWKWIRERLAENSLRHAMLLLREKLS
jgi:hypothetical protein